MDAETVEKVKEASAFLDEALEADGLFTALAEVRLWRFEVGEDG